MNQDEATTFFNECFIAFPGVSAWINANSPDYHRTIAAWCTTIEPLTKREAYSVLARMVSGAIPLPKNYEFSGFALHIKAVAAKDREVSHAQRIRDEQFRKTNVRKPLRSDFVSHVYVDGVNITNQIMDIGAKYRDGLISKEDCDFQQGVLLRKFDRACEGKKQFAMEGRD